MMARNDDGVLGEGWVTDAAGLDYLANNPDALAGGGSASGNDLGGDEPPAYNSSGDDDTPGWIGRMPEDYSIPDRPVRGNNPVWDTRTNSTPQYRQGAEFNILSSLSVPQLGGVQDQLLALGLLEEGDYIKDSMDGATIKAFEQILGLANANGQSWRQMIQTLQMAGGFNSGGSGGPTRAPFVARTANPETLKRYLRKAVVEMTGSAQGGNIDLDQMVQAYQQIQANAQRQLYDAAPSGGTVEDPVDFETYVEGEVQGQFGTEVAANSMAERAGQLLNLVAGRGARAN